MEAVGSSVRESLIGKRVLPLREKGLGKSLSKHQLSIRWKFLIVLMILQLLKCTSIQLLLGSFVRKS